MATSRKIFFIPLNGYTFLFALFALWIGLLLATFDEEMRDANRVQTMYRSVYASVEDCGADWGGRNACEEILSSDLGPSQLSELERNLRGKATNERLYMGPYYSSSRFVYGYDGTRTAQDGWPQGMLTKREYTIAPKFIYDATGRYSSTPLKDGSSMKLVREPTGFMKFLELILPSLMMLFIFAVSSVVMDGFNHRPDGRERRATGTSFDSTD
jgi:hypothetical protein